MLVVMHEDVTASLSDNSGLVTPMPIPLGISMICQIWQVDIISELTEGLHNSIQGTPKSLPLCELKRLGDYY